MSLRAATVRGLVRSPSAGVFSGADYQWNPRMLPNLAAWFDALDARTMLAGDGSTITDGGQVALWGDKSGNSGVNVLAHNASGTANSATIPAIGALGTSDFTLVAEIMYDAVSAADQSIFSIPASTNGCVFVIGAATQKLRVGKVGVGYNSAASATNIPVLTWCTVAYSRSGTTGTYYLNGAANGTATDSQNFTANDVLSFLRGNATSTTGMKMRRARVYSVALDAAGVLADYNGTVQANCTVNCDFTLAGKKLANGDTFVCATGQTVTLNSSGATGARIAGERDLFQGTLANRPVYLNYAGTKYGYLNGTAGNYFSTLDSVALDLAGDFDIRIYCAAQDWTPAAETSLVSRYGYSDNNRAFRLGWHNGGDYSKLTAQVSIAGTGVNVNAVATANVGFTDGASGWVRVTYIANSAGSFVVKFWTSTDGVSWTQLGSTVTGLAVGATFNGNAPLLIGATGNLTTNAGLFTGRVYSAQVYDGVPVADGGSGATLKADFNPALYTSGTTFTASTGEVWTINGGAHIVTRSCNYGDGVNDSLKSAAYNCPQPTTIYWVGTMESWTASDYLFDGNGTNGGALVQTASTPQVNLNAGSSAAGNTSAPLKTWGVFCAVLNGASSTLRWMRLAATTGDAGAGNMNGLTLLARGAADAGWFNGVVGEVAQYAGAHDASIQGRWALYAGRRHRFAA